MKTLEPFSRRSQALITVTEEYYKYPGDKNRICPWPQSPWETKIERKRA